MRCDFQPNVDLVCGLLKLCPSLKQLHHTLQLTKIFLYFILDIIFN